MNDDPMLRLRGVNILVRLLRERAGWPGRDAHTTNLCDRAANYIERLEEALRLLRDKDMPGEHVQQVARYALIDEDQP